MAVKSIEMEMKCTDAEARFAFTLHVCLYLLGRKVSR